MNSFKRRTELLILAAIFALSIICTRKTSFHFVPREDEGVVLATDENRVREQRSEMKSDEPKYKYKGMTASEIIQSRKNATKVILFWTPRIGVRDWARGLGKEPFSNCKYTNCENTADKGRLEEADVLLFYCQELPYFPALRYPHQLYIHMTREAPVNAKIYGYGMYGEAINITASYRKDSNLFTPYFVMRPKEQPEQDYVVRIPFHNRSRSIAWMVSNCKADSRRDLYVNELRKYIDVDIYGQCGNLTCDKGSKKSDKSCFQLFESEYKFYLAFENNICKDYYTEKLLNALDHEIVPIVFGGADYDHDFPEHSLINVVDYPNPRDLAKFLKSMTAEEYEMYFKWKAKYYIQLNEDNCDLCEFLHDSAYTRGEQILPPSYGGNYSAWWHDSCHNDLIFELKRKGDW